MLCHVMHSHAFVGIVFPFSPPSSSPVPPETDADAPEYDNVDNDPSLPKQPGKPPPPLITRYRLFFSLLLALV